MTGDPAARHPHEPGQPQHAHNDVRKFLGAAARWVAGVVAVLLTSVIVLGARAIVGQGRTIAALQEQVETAADNAQEALDWIDNWYNVLKVPERDERQDNAIDELRRRLGERRP